MTPATADFRRQADGSRSPTSGTRPQARGHRRRDRHLRPPPKRASLPGCVSTRGGSAPLRRTASFSCLSICRPVSTGRRNCAAGRLRFRTHFRTERPQGAHAKEVLRRSGAAWIGDVVSRAGAASNHRHRHSDARAGADHAGREFGDFGRRRARARGVRSPLCA